MVTIGAVDSDALAVATSHFPPCDRITGVDAASVEFAVDGPILEPPEFRDSLRHPCALRTTIETAPTVA
jgi:hypothetical protein